MPKAYPEEFVLTWFVALGRAGLAQAGGGGFRVAESCCGGGCGKTMSMTVFVVA